MDAVTVFRPAGGPGDPAEVFVGVDAVLVRPDGYVAWAGTSAAGLEAALATWFVRDTRHSASPSTP
ncbi:hypothetical protein G3M55_10275, partial [Streptomyces sp. SID8455]|nr:hypothetical protein [Streptomyces sp. SID8455]